MARGFRLKTKLLVGMILLNLVTISSYTVYLYFQTVNHELAQIERYLERSAQTMPKLLDTQFAKIFTEGEAAYTFEDYKKEVRKHSDFIFSIGLESLYAVTVKDEKILFIFDSIAQEDEAELQPILDQYKEDLSPEAEAAFLAAAKTQQKQVFEYTDAYGTFLALFLPMKDEATGQQYIVAAEYSLEEVNAVKKESLHYSLLIGGITLVIGIFLSFLLSNLIAKPILQIAEQINKTVEDRDLNADFTINSRDEIGLMGGHLQNLFLLLKSTLQSAYSDAIDNSRFSEGLMGKATSKRVGYRRSKSVVKSAGAGIQY